MTKSTLACTMVLLLLDGCGKGAPQSAADAENDILKDPVVVDIFRRYGSTSIHPLCDGKASGPSREIAFIGPVQVERRCGLITVDFEVLPESPTAQHCESASREECASAIQEVFNARVIERYERADSAWIQNHCRGYPDDCVKFIDLEVLYPKSHQQAVHSTLEAELEQLRRLRVAQAQAAKQAREAQRWNRFFQSAAIIGAARSR